MIERIHRITMPSYMALNAYIQEVKKTEKSKRGIKVIDYYHIDARDLPSHLGNNIDIGV